MNKIIFAILISCCSVAYGIDPSDFEGEYNAFAYGYNVKINKDMSILCQDQKTFSTWQWQFDHKTQTEFVWIQKSPKGTWTWIGRPIVGGGVAVTEWLNKTAKRSIVLIPLTEGD